MTKTPKTAKCITDPKAVIAVYNTHEEAESAVKELQKDGFDMKNCRSSAKTTTRRIKWWATTTQGTNEVLGQMGRLMGRIVGPAFWRGVLLGAGVGPAVVAGPLSAAIIAGLENALVVGGLSVLGAALWSIGIPKTASCDTKPQSG